MPCKSVLVVEDDDAVRFAIVETLRAELRIPVESVPNAIRGLGVAATIAKPCLMLVDLMMPGMTGMDFIEELKKSALIDDCQIIMMTASSNIKCDYPVIYKPMDLDAFLSSVKSVCH